ncbi:MAG: hypothetical protein E7585_04310 [Ruminococcaceae bacterium]|nr:hypothetical protein [Oscillospiraceae bacterium]
MKKEKLARAMNLVDDDLLEKASPYRRKEKKRPKLKRLVLVACLTGLMLALGLWLFIPFNTSPPDISMYESSEYYGIIQRLNVLTHKKPTSKNNFEKYIANIFRYTTDKDMAAAPGDAECGGEYGDEYVEATDNQVAGVIEGDRIKRSDRYIYYLNADKLEIYSIAGEESAKVATHAISPGNAGSVGNKTLFDGDWELYLSQDCRTVTVIAPFYDREVGAYYVGLISLDVSDPANITQKAQLTVSGYYLSSRMVNGELLLMSRFDVKYNPDFSDALEFVPHLDDGRGKQCLPVGDILSPDTVSSAQYTVICSLREEGLALLDHTALLSYSTDAYVSAEDIFVTRPYTEYEERDGVTYGISRTEIARVSYVDGMLAHKGSVHLNGTVKDQYSMDAYNGVLRVVTTTRVATVRKSANGENVMTVGSPALSADLYCISLFDLQTIASVIGFAPAGESAESVRFDGDIAYVCTALVAELSDPVFFFDLSDLSNITYKDTGVIEGYSTSLVNFGDGYLLGIGVGASLGNLKIEIYRESDTGVVSVCAWELENVSYSTDYKSYFIDRENSLVGLGIHEHNKTMQEGSHYILLHFNGSKLNKILREPLMGDNHGKRGLLIDGYFYLFGETDFAVKSISE